MSVAPRLASAVLRGAEVVLRPARPEDAEAAFRILHRREEILRWLVWDGPRSVGELEESYASWASEHPEGNNYLLAVEDARTGSFAGSIGPRFRGHLDRADLGYWLDPERWGRGWMTEAVRLACHLCFRHLGAARVSAQAFVGNAGSRRVLERNGFRIERVLREAVIKRGKRIDEWYFELPRERWTAEVGAWRPVEEAVELAG